MVLAVRSTGLQKQVKLKCIGLFIRFKNKADGQEIVPKPGSWKTRKDGREKGLLLVVVVVVVAIAQPFVIGNLLVS